MIEVNERFKFEKDTSGWQLHDWKLGEDKNGKPKRHKRTTYHSNLKQICAVILDRSAGQCSSLQGIVGMLENAEAIAREVAILSQLPRYNVEIVLGSGYVSPDSISEEEDTDGKYCKYEDILALIESSK